MAIAIPPGFVRRSDELSANGAVGTQFSGEVVSTVVLGEQPGALPLTVTWTQSDGTAQGVCAGSASASFTTLPAIRPHLIRPKVTRGLPDESIVKLVFPFNIRVSPRGSPYGYDLGIYQGGARRARLRVAGRCIHNGGFISTSKPRIARG